jgi:hypothetical protein
VPVVRVVVVLAVLEMMVILRVLAAQDQQILEVAVVVQDHHLQHQVAVVLVE